MKIKETQFITNDLTDYQQRIIYINSWEEYTKQFYSNILPSLTDSLPRNRQILEVIITDTSISVKFFHTYIGKSILHRAIIVKDSEKPRVIVTYQNFPKEVEEIICSETFIEMLESVDFEREYECNFNEIIKESNNE